MIGPPLNKKKRHFPWAPSQIEARNNSSVFGRGSIWRVRCGQMSIFSRCLEKLDFNLFLLVLPLSPLISSPNDKCKGPFKSHSNQSGVKSHNTFQQRWLWRKSAVVILFFLCLNWRTAEELRMFSSLQTQKKKYNAYIVGERTLQANEQPDVWQRTKKTTLFA